MKAAVIPAVNARWEIKDVPTPKAGPNQVLIRIRASGLCYTDVHITHGHIPTQFPRTIGHEPVGEIVEVGVGVTTRKVGDRVGVPWIQSSCGRCEWCARGRPMFCQQQVGTGVQTQGSHAEYMVAFAEATALLPEGLAYEQAAPIFCAGYTVWSGLRWARPEPGQTVAVLGIGGLGHLAVQYAAASGFRTVAVSRSPDKDAMIRGLGAHEIVRDGEGLRRVGGADVVLGCGNSSAAMQEVIKGIRPDGKLVVMGVDAAPIAVSPIELLTTRLQIIGSQQNHREYLYEALQMAAAGKVKVMSETFRLDDIARAYDKVSEGAVRFRAVITP
jgi:D-arabinose 1-dehydrogenase-like Zn-dependent alcohol dehydrogenase